MDLWKWPALYVKIQTMGKFGKLPILYWAVEQERVVWSVADYQKKRIALFENHCIPIQSKKFSKSKV